MNNLLTVLIPCYNSENTVSKAIDSLLDQEYELNIIVVDDGSSDNSGQILDSYASKYDNIKVIHQANKGIAATRNLLVSLVETPYFGFLDSDDLALKDYSKCFIDKIKEDNSDVIIANFMWVTSKGSKLYQDGPYELKQDMLVNIFATLWNKVYKKSFIDSLHLSFPDGNRYEDTYFLYCMTPFVSSVSFIDVPLINYIQTDGSITHTNNQQVKNMIDVFNKIDDFYTKHNIKQEYINELEYLHIRYFLGSSFLRSTRIEDKNDRIATLNLGWNLLNDKFPNWHKNPYLKNKGLKNLYFRLVNKYNYMLFANIFRIIKKDII